MLFSQGVALGYLILPLQGKCIHTAKIYRSLISTARKQTVAHASGSERYVFLPWLLLLLILPSVFFRVIPC